MALIEVAAPIAEKIEETKEIKCDTLPGGKMVKIVHNGPYDACGPTYETIFRWIERTGKTLAGPARKAYLNDPRDVGVEQAVTEIYVTIK
jgi:AraC family transcriptional regulator